MAVLSLEPAFDDPLTGHLAREGTEGGGRGVVRDEARTLDLEPEDLRDGVSGRLVAGPKDRSDVVTAAGRHREHRHLSFVHAVELDRRLEPALAEALAGADNVAVVWGDALRIELEELRPAPTRLVANLPYAIATPLLLSSLWRLPEVERWCVMVQREVADRWLAPPGSRLYGGPSVLLQLAAAPTFRRPVPRESFLPRPHVDSVLVALRRTGPAPDPATRALVRAAFAQRRKTLANALAGAGADKGAVVAALADAGLGAAARPEALPPAAFPALARALQWPA